jgi:hypothetical protein
MPRPHSSGRSAVGGRQERRDPARGCGPIAPALAGPSREPTPTPPPPGGRRRARSVGGRAARRPAQGPDRQDGGASGPDDMDKRPERPKVPWQPVSNPSRPRRSRPGAAAERTELRFRAHLIRRPSAVRMRARTNSTAGARTNSTPQAPRQNELGAAPKRTRTGCRTNRTAGANELDGRRPNELGAAPRRTRPRRRTNPMASVGLVGWAPPTIPNAMILKGMRRWAVPTLRRVTVVANELDAVPERTRRPARTNSSPGAGRTVRPRRGTHDRANRSRLAPSETGSCEG